VRYHEVMKLGFFLVFPMVLAACGGGSPGDDAGGPDASTDATAADAGSSDGSPDADAASDAAQDAGLGAGELCDLNNDQCGPGLKCCAGGAVSLDGGTGHCLAVNDAGKCPPIP
jgi:hypothetical protein